MFSVGLLSAALTFHILNFLGVTTIVLSEPFSAKLGTNYHFQVCSNEGPFFLPWIPIWPSIIKRIYFSKTVQPTIIFISLIRLYCIVHHLHRTKPGTKLPLYTAFKFVQVKGRVPYLYWVFNFVISYRGSLRTDTMYNISETPSELLIISF